ncbi:MAG: DUF1800 domain-containing protein [Rhodobacteraceae bacterium]|nr:DUF1800 domain-containing protein [Paracoccaceae bacterium]
MGFDPIRAEMRFGCGLSPVIAPPKSVDDMLDGVLGRDPMAERFPITLFDTFRAWIVERRDIRREIKSTTTTDEARQEAAAKEKAFIRGVNDEALHWLRQAMQRRVQTRDGFRERLSAFWGDHFTAYGRGPVLKVATGPYLEEAIRPHIAGRFEDLLIAAVTHPLMLHFLNQDQSIGPNSEIAQKRSGRGLNENLAREVLELHTLGVEGPYTQGDVRQLAELFTGLDWTPAKGPLFRTGAVEPGAETVLGRRYGEAAGLGPVHAVLRDLARHPATARHIARKLAVHFVADQPDEALIGAMVAQYEATDGDLLAVYEAMLRHPAAWSAGASNIKRPIDFVATSLRALALPQADLGAWGAKRINRQLRRPLERMGQPWERPIGPDGWAEEDTAWATPQGMAGRLQWALALPELLQRDVPDPREFVEAALGPGAPERVRFAAKAAENRREGVALVLMSPAFQRV